MNMHHEKQILDIADEISKKVLIGKIKFIGISGPSGGGKTTFTKKLGTALKSKGIEPVVLSMDDYYKSIVDCLHFHFHLFLYFHEYLKLFSSYYFFFR